MWKPKFYVLLALLMVLSVGAFAQDSLAPWLMRLDARLLNLEQYRGFSGVVLVAEGDSLTFLHAYGMADEKEEKKLKPSNKFMIASLSKAFTATAIMQLVEKERISLDDSISKFYPDLEIPYGNKITIRNLLNHTSGIPDYINDYPIRFRARVRLGWKPEQQKMIEKIVQRRLEFRPGDEFNYSNSGYFLLADIVEKISKKSFKEYVQTEILDVIGLPSVGMDNANDVSGIPQAYRGKFFHKRKVKNLHPSAIFGMGGMYADAEDLFKWTRGLLQGKVLKDSSLKMVFDPGDYHYGLGWEVEFELGQKVFAHGGYLPGWNSHIRHLADDDVTVIVVSNYDDVDPEYLTGAATLMWFNNQIVDTIPAMEASAREEWTGRYKRADFGSDVEGPFNEDVLVLIPSWAGIVLKLANGEEFQLFSKGENNWETRNGEISVEITTSGIKQQEIQIKRSAKSWKWVKI